MKPRTLIITGLAAVLAIFGVMIASNPLRRSEEQISVWLQNQTPLGSSREAVVAYAKMKKWYNPSLQGSDGKTKGEFVRGELGEYRNFFITSVTVFWEFDSTSRLERIRIWKTVDAP